MLSIADTLQQELNSPAPQLCYVVSLGSEIVTTPDAEHIRAFCSPPPDPSVDIPHYCDPIVTKINPSGTEIDPLTGDVSGGSVSVTLALTAEVREMIETKRLPSKELSIKVGVPGSTMASGDAIKTRWPWYFRGTITNASADRARAVITAKTFDSEQESAYQSLASRRMSSLIPAYHGGASNGIGDFAEQGFYSHGHPLDTIRQGFEWVGVPSSWLDAASLDPTDASVDAIRHYCCSRTATEARDNRILDRTPAIDLFRPLAWLSGGHLVIQENGKLTFTLYDSSASSVFEFTDAIDILEIRAENRIADVITSAFVETHYIQEGSGNAGESSSFAAQMMVEEAVAAASFGWDLAGSNPGQNGLDLQDEWFGGSMVNEDTWDGTMTSIHLLPPGHPNYVVLGLESDTGGWTGWAHGGTTNVGVANSTHKGYLLIVNSDAGESGIYSYESIALSVSTMILSTVAKISGDTIASTDPGDLQCYDITPIYNTVNDLLERFADGPLAIQLTTTMRSLPVQIGDLVTLDTTQVHGYGFDGDTGSQKFQVVGKIPTPDKHAVEWMLLEATARTLSALFTTADLDRMSGPLAASQSLETAWGDRDSVSGMTDNYDGFGFAPSVLTDALPAVPARGLNLTIPDQAYLADGAQKIVPATTQIMSASKDTYVYLGNSRTSRGRILLSEVANGAAQPTTPTGSQSWIIVVTDGSDITAVVANVNRGLVGSDAMTPSERLSQFSEDERHNSALSGFEMTPAGGMKHSIPTGVVLVDGVRKAKAYAESHTFTASRHTWIEMDEDGGLNYSEKAIDADEDIQAKPGRTRIGVATTGAAALTSFFKFPCERSMSSDAVNPQAIRDGFTPNAMLDDLDVSAKMPRGWTADAGTGATIESATAARAGRYVLDCVLTDAATTSYIRSDAFPIAANARYHATVMYDTDGVSFYPETSIGLEYFDAWGRSLGTRNFVLDATAITDVATHEGGRLTGVIRGAGAADDQIPATARYARWVIQLDKDASGTSGVSWSEFMLEVTPAAGTTLLATEQDATAPGSIVSENAGTWTDLESISVDAPYLSSVAARTVPVKVTAHLTFSGNTAGDYIEARIYDWSNTTASTSNPRQRIISTDANGRDGCLALGHIFNVPDGTSATIKLQFRRQAGTGIVYVDNRDIEAVVARNQDE